MRVVVDDGVGLEVTEVGQGPVLVLVHGFGGAKEDFADHVPALSARYRVVTFDHRGHGESDGPDDEAAYSLDRMAADTLAVCDAIGADRFRLLGHSMGGMTARRIALANPERLDALVLMDTSPGPVPGIDGEVIEVGIEIARTDGMDELKRVMDAFQPLGTAAYERLVRDRPGYVEFNDRKWAALAQAMWISMIREIRDQPDELAGLAGVTVPALVIVGEQDEPFVAVSRAMAETLPDADFAGIPDAGHSPQFENPDAWLAALEAFLARVDRHDETSAA